MRVAVCLSGQIRDFDHVRATLRRRILARLRDHQVDIYAHYPVDNKTPRLGLDFARLCQEDESSVQIPLAEGAVHDIADRPWHRGKSLRAFYLQLRSIYLANELKRESEQKLGFFMIGFSGCGSTTFTLETSLKTSISWILGISTFQGMTTDSATMIDLLLAGHG